MLRHSHLWYSDTIRSIFFLSGHSIKNEKLKKDISYFKQFKIIFRYSRYCKRRNFSLNFVSVAFVSCLFKKRILKIFIEFEIENFVIVEFEVRSIVEGRSIFPWSYLSYTHSYPCPFISETGRNEKNKKERATRNEK